MSCVAAEAASTHTMMLAPDHAAQPGEIALRAIDVNAIEKAVSIRVVDPLKVESTGKLVPMRRLVSDECGGRGNF